jgi:hypothetical protein
MAESSASPPGPRPKVFCIGFHKTGTKSLAAALRVLGYRVTGMNAGRDPDIVANALPRALALAERFDAFQDNPWPLLFREMDAHFPGSRFVLTHRAPEAWIASVVRHFGTGDSPMRRWIYGEDAGSPVGHEARYLARYARHRAEVRAHFRDRPGDLLEIDVTAGDGWAPLCGFLGEPVPDVPFPHANRADARVGATSG